MTDLSPTAPAAVEIIAPAGPTRQERAAELIGVAVEQWKTVHHPGLDLAEQTRMITARVPAWIAPTSVVAGVGDILSGVRTQDGTRPSVEQINQLGTEIATVLRDHGLLAAVPRRGGLLAT